MAERYQAAELALQDCRTFVRVGGNVAARRAEGPYHLERFPDKVASALERTTALLRDSERAFGPDHPQTAAILASLARLYEEQGARLDLAEACYRRALAIQRGAGGPEAAGAQLDLGLFLASTGRYPEAQHCLESALALQPRSLPALRALGRLHEELGDYASAEARYRDALAFADTDLEKARTLLRLASLAVKQGDLAGCARLAGESERLVANPASGAGSGDRFLAAMQTTVPLVCQGRILDAARKVSGRFQAILERDEWAQYLGELNDYVYPSILGGRTWAASLGGALLVQAAETQTRETFGAGHPQMAAALGNSCLYHIVRRAWDEAIPPAVRANEINYAHVPLVFALASERQKLRFAEQSEGYRDLLLSACIGAGGKEAAEALRWTLRMKGIVLDSMIGERQVLRRGLAPELVPVQERLGLVLGELAALHLKGPGADVAGHGARMAALTGEQEALERRLSEGSAAFREDREQFRATPAAVAARMPPGSALVEYVAFANYGRPGNPPWLAAFVLEAGPGSAPVLVDLGPAAPVEEAIRTWRKEVAAFAARGGDEGRAMAELAAKGRAAAALFWTPVAERAGLLNKRTVFIAPDGPLHLIPFAALPVAGGWLGQVADLGLVTSGRDFLRERPAPGAGGVLLVGGVDFGPEPAEAGGTPGPEAPLRRARWAPLPGTAEEVRAIAAAFQGQGLAVRLLEGAGARKGEVCPALAGARYVHLATHGFFLGEEAGLDEGGRGLAVVGHLPAEPTVPLKTAPVYHKVNPLLLSGLVLAGANQAGGAPEGYLLAMEVVNLDLAGAELVTLSACETGLGEIKRGEGVFGLQRSFLLAGARALVMSLWNVPDRETRDLMVAFYAERLSGRKGRDAFRAAQLKLMGGGAGGSPRHPWTWAAFQYLGPE